MAARVRTQVRVEVERKAPAWYAPLFQQLFPDVWHEFARGIVRQTLAEVLAERDEDLAKVTGEAPPVSVFFDLMNERYFPLSECWLDRIEMSEPGDEYAWHEIPIETIFYVHGADPHDLLPVFQVLATLGGDAPYHLDCRFKDCALRPVYLITANELHKVDARMLDGLCRKEKTPLRHLAFALKVLNEDTGNVWFDYNDEMYGGTGCDWGAETVRFLKRDYEAASKQADGVVELNNWLRDDARRVRDAAALWRRCAA